MFHVDKDHQTLIFREWLECSERGGHAEKPAREIAKDSSNFCHLEVVTNPLWEVLLRPLLNIHINQVHQAKLQRLKFIQRLHRL